MKNRVKMLKTVPGSEDGLHVTTFQKDGEYQIGDALLANFVEMGAVELVEDPAEAKKKAEADAEAAAKAKADAEKEEAEAKKKAEAPPAGKGK